MDIEYPAQTEAITKDLTEKYSSFRKIFEHEYFTVLEAVNSEDNKKYSIRLISTNSEFFKKDSDAAKTLFMQEAMHLCSRIANVDKVKIEDFAILDDDIRFIMLSYKTLKEGFPEDPSMHVNVSKLLEDLATELDFLYNKMLILGLPLDPNNIYYISEANVFFIGRWNRSPCIEDETVDTSKAYEEALAIRKKSYIPKYAAPELLSDSVDLQSSNALPAIDIFAIALICLEALGIHQSLWDNLGAIKDEKEYEKALAAIKKALDESKQADKTKDQLIRMLKQKAFDRIRFDQLVPKSLTSLVAYCQVNKNTIHLHDYYRNEGLRPGNGPWLGDMTECVLLREIHNSHFLISAASTEDRAIYQVVDTSKDYKNVYESKETNGYIFDIATSQNTKKVALLSTSGKTIYHLLSTDNWTTDEQKWLPAHKDNIITSLTFGNEGEKIATFDSAGVLVVSEVKSNNALFDVAFGSHNRNGKSISLFLIAIKTGNNRARWNAYTPGIAVLFDSSYLDIVDADKRGRLPKAIELGSKCSWLDWRYDGYLMAVATLDGLVKIVDERENKVVREFSFGDSPLSSVRWSASGDRFVTASVDGEINLVEFKTGDTITTSRVGGKVTSACFVETFEYGVSS